MSTDVTNSGSWSSYFASPVAAASALVPTFYGFMRATAQQTDKKPGFTYGHSVLEGCKASPTLASIVAVQNAVQGWAEKQLLKRFNVQEEDSAAKFASVLTAAAAAGLLSSPAFAVVKGRSGGLGWVESLKRFRFNQAAAIGGRETGCVLGYRMSDPVTQSAKEHFGDNWFVKTVASFVSGAAGSIVGHPCDTALAVWQEGKKLETFKDSWKGLRARTLAGGAFTALMYLVKDKLN